MDVGFLQEECLDQKGLSTTFKWEVKEDSGSLRPLPLWPPQELQRPESAREPGGALSPGGLGRRWGAARRRALGGCAVRTSKPG